VSASDLKTFFESKSGSWSLLSGWSKEFSSDGPADSEFITTFSSLSVRGGQSHWSVYQEFCNRSLNTEMCGRSLNIFEIEGADLYLIDESNQSKIKVDILSLSEAELSYRFELNGMVFIVSQKISENILTENTRIERDGKLIGLSFLSSKSTH
jgi:hypothetical protein